MTNPTPTSGAADRCQACVDRNDGFYGSYAPQCPAHNDDGTPRETALANAPQPALTAQAISAEPAGAAQAPSVPAVGVPSDAQIWAAREAWSEQGNEHEAMRAALVAGSAAPQPAPPADSVLEDAARYQWLADYLVGDLTDPDDEIVACKSVCDLSKVVDAARKQGGANG